FGDQSLELSLALFKRLLSQVVAVEIKKVESHHDDLVGLAAQLVLQHGEVGGAVGGRHHDLAIDDGRTGGDQKRVVGNFLEPVGPVVAVAGEHPGRLVGDV